MTVEETNRVDEAYLLPASYGQRRLWFLDQLEPSGRCSAIEHGALRIRGSLEVAALQGSLDDLVARHETLRTRFLVLEGEPIQAVLPRLRVPIVHQQALGVVPPEADTEQVRAALAGRLRAELDRPFDLLEAPLFRAALVELGPDDHVLLVAFHHAIYDQWSGAVFVRELLAGYDARLAGTPAPPEPAVQYGDFAGWQHEWAGGPEETGQLAYWENELAGSVPLELPTDAPRGTSRTFAGATVEANWSPELVSQLEAVARTHRATVFMTVLAGFTAVLARHADQEDVAVGTPVAGRRAPELDGLIGFFVNTLVIRTDLSGDPDFSTLLGRVRDRCLAGYANADVPFERLVQRLRPARDLARSPLFSVMFVFGNVPLPALTATGLTATLFRVDPGTAKFDLFVSCVPADDGGLRVTVEYNSDLFSTATANRLLDHLHRLLTGAVAAPGTAVSALPLLAPDELARLVRWGTGPQRSLPEATVPQLVRAQAAATPDAVAVRGRSGELSYAGLLARAEAIAERLRAAGVRPGQLIPVAVDRDIDLPAVLLGILDCAAAYLPVDTALPAERIRWVLADSGAELVLADPGAAEVLAGPEGTGALPAGVAVIRLPAADQTTAMEAPTDENGPGPDDLAYVIYTSGSTGTPKGVAVTHRSLVNLLTTMAERPGLDAGDIFAAVTTLAFDIAGLELFGPLLAGGCVDVVPREVASDGALLAAHLTASGATVMQATPTTWRLLAAAGWRPAKGFAAWCGGERVPAELAGWLVGVGAVVWHLYGPTETTVWSSVGLVVGGEGSLVLGSAVANTELLVVDSRMCRVPVGVPGELVIGGVGVASGYWRRPELTAERFVGHPEVGGVGRVYRTGDVVRWRSDGGLEFLGRADFQVKVRGYRVELGEIEAVVVGCVGVGEAVVVVRGEGVGDPRVVAYVVLDGSEVGGEVVARVRAQCRRQLPEYMVPTAFVVLPAFPLTPNGKLDRTALPEPEARRSEHGYVAPGSTLEQRVAAIMAEVLGLDRVGADDDFFALGGHSLLATALVGRIATDLGAELGVRTVFTHPTVAQLSAALPDGSDSTTPVDVEALPASPARPDQVASAPPRRITTAVVARELDDHGQVRLPASFQQRRVWFLAELDPDQAGAYLLHGGVRLSGPLQRPVLRRAVKLVLDRHEVLRTGLVAEDGEPVQVVHAQVPDPVSEVDLAGAENPETALAELIREQVALPFDLAEPPLLRLTLAALGPDEAALVVVIHHAVADRLAVEVLITELSVAYTALALGEAPRLPALAVQYGDYAAAQRQWAGGDQERAQLGYWRAQLADLPVLDLPTDRPRPAVRTHRGATARLQLPADLVTRLGAVAAKRGATLFMATLAGYAAVLARYGRAEQVAVGSPVSGRDRPELEPLVGYFTNNLVLRVDLSGDPTVEELLDHVRGTCLDAFAQADVPFERLVEDLRPRRDLDQSPLFQAMFIAAHLPAPAPRLGQARATALDTPVTSAKYDLTFTVFPTSAAGDAQTVVVEYDAELFDAATIERMLAQYLLVLTAFAESPERPLSQLPTLPSDERAQLLSWGTGPRRAVPEVGLTGLLDPRLIEFRDRVAVTDLTGEYRYGELDARANQLARHLRQLGVGRGERVALFCDRERDLLVALLGVLRSGAAYVPVDVDFPSERVTFLLEDSAATVLLTGQALVDRLPEQLPERLTGRVLCLDRDWEQMAQWPAEPLADGPGPDDLAYVIYTSGSTGHPKGVLLPHRAVVNFLLTMAERPGMNSEDVVGAANTISCDMPVLDLYLPLLVGARIAMVPREVTADGERLAAHLAGTGISYLQGTPTTWQLLRQVGWRPAGRFTALAGAERVPAELAGWLVGVGAVVWHLYGPTETTVWSSVGLVVGGEGSLVLGSAVANTELLVVDSRMCRVPVGVPGELVIGGVGVASGYWRRPELTAERFVGHPEVGGVGRVYRTGDVVRWRSDGGLEFLGRADFQVKVRGYRVELGEIEAVVVGCVGVGEAVVVVRGEGVGDPRVVAYVVLDGSEVGGEVVARVRAQCRRQLPAHMVPAAVVVLDALPLTANRNKIDRAALPAPDGARPQVGAFVEPRSPQERQVAAIMAEVLGLDRVGADDDFFALGGHSLLATRLVARLRAAFAVDLPVRAVFSHPTVAGLVTDLPADLASGETVDPTGSGPTATSIPAVGRQPEPAIVAQFRMPQVGGDLAGRYVFPAGTGQRRLWFLDRLDPDSAAAYTVDTAVALTGPLEVAAVQVAVTAVVRRHEALRTGLAEVDGEPVQVVLPPDHPDARVIVDLVDLPAVSELADPVIEALAGLSARPFDLAVAPLLRVTLLRLADHRHVLHLALHHAVSDRWSLQILARDLVAAYDEARAASGPADTAPASVHRPIPAVQYGDVAAWQQQWLAGDRAAAQLAHWRARLADLPVLELPTDRPRSAVRGYRGDLCWRRLDSELVHRLTGLGRAHGATVFMVTLAALQVMLSRYSGQRDFAVGAPVAGRGREELTDVIGFLANTVVLRADLAGDPSVGELLDRVRATCLDAFDQADLPFDTLVAQLAPARHRARTPLFNVLFAVQNTPPAGQRMGPAVVTPIDLRPGTAQFDLSVMLIPDPEAGDLRLRVEYDTDLFDATTVDRMIEQYILVLTEFSADPDRRLSGLEPLTVTERRRLLDEWVRTDELPAGPGLAAAFAAQATQTPGAVAVEFGPQQVTYAELARRAGALAARLRAGGVSLGDRIGLLVERTLDLPVAVLGVLGAGAAYVPLDPSWPTERMAYVLADAGVSVLVASAGSAPRPGFSGLVVPVSPEGDDSADGAGLVGGAVAGPDDLAYVIYTSGSTGRPKGVMITHRNVTRLVAGARRSFDLSADDVWSLCHSVAFDVSVFETWGAWLTGGRVVVVPYLASRDPDELWQLLAAHRVSVLSQTPTAFRQLAAVADHAERLDALRYVVFAGEALDRRLLADWITRYGDRSPELINLYGTTETTVHATTHRVLAGELATPERSLIGRPLPDLRIRLLDGDQRPVPLGAIGEIYLGGAGLAQGYVGRPELTAERFVRDPFLDASAVPEPRLYRTGDLARWLPEGVLDFLGRIDGQLKIRGFRVEPGEVEAVLREHPLVADAVVVARLGPAGDAELAAYVVGEPRSRPVVTHLLEHARRLLPDYLTPATFTVLNTLPRTANGKIDVAGLPDPKRSSSVGQVAPRDALERQLAQIWQDVLGVPSIGVDDDFFALGGHSLLATRVVSRARAALGRNVGVRDLFDRPTVAGLAAGLRSGGAVDGEATTVALPREPGPDGTIVLPAASGQIRLVLLNQLDPASAGAYVIGSAVRLTGSLDVGALEGAIALVVHRHEPLRTGFDTADGVPVQVVHPELPVPVLRMDLSTTNDQQAAVAELARVRLAAPFDLAVPPLIRVTLARLGPSEHVLLLALHHAIGDQWSTRVFVADLVAAYQGVLAGRTADLPALPVQFADVAAKRATELAAGAGRADLDHWVAHLSGLPALDLPTDRPRPPVPSYRGAQRTARVPADVVTALGEAARHQRATPFMAALAAFQLLLSRLSGQVDFGVATPFAGRDAPGTQELVGFFANTLILRADLSGSPTVGDLLTRVRHTCVRAYTHAGTPFDEVLRRLEVVRDPSRTPLAQVGFALVEPVAAQHREFAGVRAEPMEFDPSTAKTDLTVTLVPEDDGGWRLIAEYATDLLDGATVDRALTHLIMLLGELGGDPRRPVADLPPLPALEQAQLAQWSRGPVFDLPAVTWPDLFEAQIAATGSRIALCHNDIEIDYATLNVRVNRLAHLLIDLGIGPDRLVAVVAERSVEMVVAVLAVSKAGGAYVPIDPGYPAERVAFMIDDSGPDVVLTQSHLVGRFPVGATRVVLLDGGQDADRPVGDPPRRCGPDDLAYVIYTSGSTGTPKGVCVAHRSVVNLHLTRDLAGLPDHSRVLQFAPFSFDVSVFELVLALLGGHTLVIPTAADLAGGVEIVQLINRQRVTFTFIPPSLLAHLDPAQLPTVEVVGSGGEDCPAEVAARWGGRKRFLIGYGPTEATVYATVSDEIVGGGHPPIGRPVANTLVRVLDARLRPCPIGVPGELYLGGPGLARGYLNRPVETAAAFQTDPGTGERLYRTGDRVRWLPDGNLEFLGRVDDQVKIRGFRVELGEVAAALRADPQVREAVAAVREDTPGDQRLVGYVVANLEPDSADSESEDLATLPRRLRDALAERLPHYLVPAGVVVLPVLPMTPNGKVDRAALPAPQNTGAGDGAGYRAPRTDTEHRLARLLAEALRVERVGVDDDFFALGGHSLLAARVHASLRRIWRVDLPVRVLFEHPRVGALAAVLDEAGTLDPAVAEAEHLAALRADIVLPDDIRPAGAVSWPSNPETVLITGATGFLGAFLVEQLAEAGATVLCLVRGADDQKAQVRLERQLTRWRRWRSGWAGRVRAVAADLAAPRLGLTEERFVDLARQVDEIYHAGAEVNFLRPYALLRDANVRGTVEILRLATREKSIPVHYISTLSVFAGLAAQQADPAAEAVLPEWDEPPAVPPPAGDTGYNHSKWVAEHVVALARARGLPVVVYRPGRIGGDLRSGVWRTDDLVSQVIRACAVTGLVPDAGLATDLVPVDHLAEVIAAIARRPDAAGHAYHFALAQKVPLVRLAEVLTAGGWPARPVPLAQWYAAVAAAAEAGDDQLGLVAAMYGPLARRGVVGAGEPVIDVAARRQVLADQLAPPQVDSAVLTRYLIWLAADGFLPPAGDSERSGGH